MPLNDLLQTGLRYGAEYKDRLSSHLPMALIALHRLGGTDDELQRFNDRYVRRLEPIDAGVAPVDGDGWTALLGQHSRNADLRQRFQQDIAARGTDDVLRASLPTLLPGVAGGAFHPLIRLAYGLEAQHDGEIAEALASWVMAHLPLPQQGPASTTVDTLDEVAAALRAQPTLQAYVASGGNIFERLAAVNAMPAFQERPAPKTLTLDGMRQFALRVYAADDSFTALHMVTASHAARVVAEAVPDVAPLLLRELWIALAAAYVTVDMPEPVAPPPPTHAWADIVAQARTSTDDHVVKFVHSCQVEAQHYDDDTYRSLAARKAKLA